MHASTRCSPRPARADRWDDLDPLAFSGTYGEYLVTKVARVFPDLRDAVIPDAG